MHSANYTSWAKIVKKLCTPKEFRETLIYWSDLSKGLYDKYFKTAPTEDCLEHHKSAKKHYDALKCV